eukprot:11171627-Lingulodinium_polyedra.AAC.1
MWPPPAPSGSQRARSPTRRRNTLTPGPGASAGPSWPATSSGTPAPGSPGGGMRPALARREPILTGNARQGYRQRPG